MINGHLCAIDRYRRKTIHKRHTARPVPGMYLVDPLMPVQSRASPCGNKRCSAIPGKFPDRCYRQVRHASIRVEDLVCSRAAPNKNRAAGSLVPLLTSLASFPRPRMKMTRVNSVYPRERENPPDHPNSHPEKSPGKSHRRHHELPPSFCQLIPPTRHPLESKRLDSPAYSLID